MIIKKAGLGCAMLALFGLAGPTLALSPGIDGRFYITPMLSYGFFDEDNLDPEDNLGLRLLAGKRLLDHLALEAYVFHFDSVESERTNIEFDHTGYGLNALLYPLPRQLHLFLLAGFGGGDYDFYGAPSNLADADSDHYEFGLGGSLPITAYGLSLRADYRYRSTDADFPGPSNLDFRDNIISLGLQIPLGKRVGASDELSTPRSYPTEPAPRRPRPVRPAPRPVPPPPDRDNDGVIDRLDACPQTLPDTRINSNGCPVLGLREPPPPKVPDTIVLRGVHFEYDSARLTAQARNRLGNVADALHNEPRIRVLIAGHTDNVASRDYNLSLSRQRADSVRSYLVSQGVDAYRLETRGYGETRPVASNQTAEGRAENRRVELRVIRP